MLRNLCHFYIIKVQVKDNKKLMRHIEQLKQMIEYQTSLSIAHHNFFKWRKMFCLNLCCFVGICLNLFAFRTFLVCSQFLWLVPHLEPFFLRNCTKSTIFVFSVNTSSMLCSGLACWCSPSLT